MPRLFRFRRRPGVLPIDPAEQAVLDELRRRRAPTPTPPAASNRSAQ